MAPSAPSVSRVNISQIPMRMQSARFHGRFTPPLTMSRAICAGERSNSGGKARDDDEKDRAPAERYDHQAEGEHEPRHGAPAPARADGAGQDLEEVGKRAHRRVGNRPRPGNIGSNNRLRAVLSLFRSGEKRLPDAVDVAELVRGEVARDVQA